MCGSLKLEARVVGSVVVKRGSASNKRRVMKDMMVMMMTTMTIINIWYQTYTQTELVLCRRRIIRELYAAIYSDAQTIDEKLIKMEYYHKTTCFNIGVCF